MVQCVGNCHRLKVEKVATILSISVRNNKSLRTENDTERRATFK